MTTTATPPSKVTYTSANVDWEAFHRQFDAALGVVRGQLGRDYPLYIGGEPITSSAAPIVDTSPIDTESVLGRFATASVVSRSAAAPPRCTGIITVVRSVMAASTLWASI